MSASTRDSTTNIPGRSTVRNPSLPKRRDEIRSMTGKLPTIRPGSDELQAPILARDPGSWTTFLEGRNQTKRMNQPSHPALPQHN